MVANEDSQGVYKLIVIGGGPAGIGVFVRAARLGMLSRLLNPEAHGKPPDLERVQALGKTQKGVAILHDGDASSFGSGNLGAYIINSNTFANSLTSSVLDDKPDMDPPERTVGTFLERARQHASAQRLEQIGAAPACLMDIGKFLHHVGACVMEEMEAIAPTSSKCFLSTKGTRLDILENGLIRVEAQPSGGESFSLLTEHVALATGGEQERPVLDLPHLRSKLFMSDECVRDEGFARLRSLLLESQVTGGDKAMKVCLVGGSHSAFSVAWLLLNKFRRAQSPILFRSSADAAGSRSTSPTKTQSISESISSAPTPLDEPISSPSAVCSAASEGSDSPLRAVLPTVTPSPLATSPSKSESVRKPTGPMPAFKPKDITLLHRTPIRCYYGSRKDAEADGADGSRVDRGGCVNTFTGLREDAKALYNSVRAGKETRVRLFQINRQGSQTLSAKAYDSASAIVWCCGYKTRMPPVFDSDNNIVSFLSENGVVKLDNKGRLQLAAPSGLTSSANGSSDETSSLQNAVARIMGLGIGFHLRAPVDEMGGETRADGVTVYHRRGASLVLEALFGSEVYGSSTSFEEMVEKLDKKKRETTATSPATTALGSGASTKLGEPSGSPEKIKRASKMTNPLVVTGEVSCAPNCATSGSATKPRSSVAVSPANKPKSLALQMTASPMRRASTDRPELIPAVIAFGGTESPPTNPPVKLLLNRRRQSGEDHSALVAASHHHQASHRPKIPSGPVSSPPRVCRDASLPTALSIVSPPAETGA